MRLLYNTTDFNKTIKFAAELRDSYDKSVIFHSYWNGNLNKKHLYSVLSCYYFNVLNQKHKIVLWLENNIPNNINREISKYCEIKQFSIHNETVNTFLENKKITYIRGLGNGLSEKANFYRMVLLYNYGGCWFDLDCFFLRSFDPIFKNYEKEICLYQWERQNYPNNAIFISLEPRSIKMKNNINFIINRNRGWGFQRAELTYDSDLDMLILPCSWFDGSWVQNPYRIGTSNFLEKTNKQYNFDNFFKGTFCYHWHNQWDKEIEENSIIDQLGLLILSDINQFCIQRF